MPTQLARGLKRYGREHKTSEIIEDLKDVADDPAALAVWIRRMAIGDKAFEGHQKAARAKMKK